VENALIVPEPVRLRALASGQAGAAWLAGLARAVAELAQEWGLTIGGVLVGGTEALVVEATLADGRAAVLKIYPPGQMAAGELQTLLAARGRGYAAVYAADAARSVVLLERLGPPLAALGLPVDIQLAAICETLAEAWAAPPDGGPLMTGAEKASSLSDFIEATWRALGRPCSGLVIDTARRSAEERRLAFDPRTAVLGHGDAHAWNTLLVPGSTPQRFKFVDPDGLLIERAYDLGIAMREWSSELLAGDPAALGIQRCRRLAALTGVAPLPIWQWGFIERTSTGLLCLQIGLEGGREMLTVAERWASVRPEDL
jgi:streptomycin 6-kinase